MKESSLFAIREGTRFEQYDRLVSLAIDETKTGGDPQKAIAFAILANAEARVATEFDGHVELGR